MKNCTSFILALTVFAFSFSAAQAQLYWDTDPGSNGAAGNGNWDSITANWNLDSSGVAATQLWGQISPPDDPVAFFSAPGSSSYTVSVASNQSAGGLTFNDSLVTVDSTGGTLTLTGTAPTVTLGSGIEATISAPISGASGLAVSGSGLAALTLSSTGNNYTGATTLGAGATLKLGASGVIPDASVLTIAQGSTQTKFDLNLKDETVRSLSSTGAGSSPTIALGVNTLTLNDQSGDTFTYNGLVSSSAGGKIVKNGQGTLIFDTSITNPFASGEIVINRGTFGISQNNAMGVYGSNTTLTINSAGNLGNEVIIKKTGSAAQGTNWGVRNVNINGSFTMDINGASNTQTTGGATGTADVGNMDITLGADNPTITVMTSTSTSTPGIFILAGRIRNGAGANNRGFTKAGALTMNIGNKGNDYRGDTVIQEGTLRVINQFFNALSTGANGPGKLGDATTSTVRLAGGILEFNGSPALNADFTAANGTRTMTVDNAIAVSADSGIRYTSTTAALGTNNNIDFIFTSNSVSGTGGTLTLSNNGACTDNGSSCPFRPTFSGTGFTFGQPVVINNHTSVATRTTTLTSTNTSGAQTWSNVISGTGSLMRNGVGGTTILNGANTFSGGATVQAGSLQASGLSATLGAGNVTVTGGNIEIVSGVGGAIANTATLSIAGGGGAQAILGAGVNERVGTLVLNAVTQAYGLTYGSTSSSALIQSNVFFAGTGIVEAGVPGDFNHDNNVDAADYVTWRMSPSTYAGTPGYNLWRSHFGAVGPGAGGGSGLGAAAVPEPSSIALLLLSIVAMAGRRGRR